VVLCIARVARTQAANFLRLHYLPRSCSKLTPVDLRVETLTRLPWQRGGGVRRAKKRFRSMLVSQAGLDASPGREK
jgi:hypothetical protein